MFMFFLLYQKSYFEFDDFIVEFICSVQSGMNLSLLD